MRVSAVVQEVQGNGAYCRDCMDDEWAVADGRSWETVVKETASLPKGTMALKISVSYKPAGTVYLCLTHAECLAENITRQLP
jgi:hypothetical protein